MIRSSFKTLSLGLIAFASMLAAPSAANASTLTYTVTGGLITGTLNGTPFTNATWSITGTADPANVISGTFSFGPKSIPNNFLAMAPLLTIATGSSTLQATLVTTGSAGEQMGLGSFDYGQVVAGLTSDVFISRPANGQYINFAPTMGLQGPGIYTTLQSPFSGTGVSAARNTNYSTDIGILAITSGTGQAGTFTVSAASPSPVPEIDPATGSSALSLVAGLLAMVEQRRRRGLKAGLAG